MAELMNYAKSTRFTPREKLALRYADAIMYDPAQADDALWAELHAEFRNPNSSNSVTGSVSPSAASAG